MQCCLEHLGQHCIGFSAVECHPKSMKTTLHKIFSYVMLSGVAQTTLHRVFSYAILSQEYILRHCTKFFYAMLFVLLSVHQNGFK